jgi:hypothetical protein
MDLLSLGVEEFPERCIVTFLLTFVLLLVVAVADVAIITSLLTPRNLDGTAVTVKELVLCLFQGGFLHTAAQTAIVIMTFASQPWCIPIILGIVFLVSSFKWKPDGEAQTFL